MSDLLPTIFPEGLLAYEPLEDGFAFEPPAPYQRTDMQQGPANQERIFRNGIASFDCSWPMTPDEFEIFQGWLEDTGGAYAWHSAELFRGNRYETLKARFVLGTYKTTFTGGEWNVTGRLETYAYRPMSGDELAALMLTAGSNQSVDNLVRTLRAALFDMAGAIRDANL